MKIRNPLGRHAEIHAAPLKRAEQFDHAGPLEIVVPYTGPENTSGALERAATLTAGLNPTLKFVAVYIAPYPAELSCPPGVERRLTARLSELAERTSLPSRVDLVIARDRNEGYRRILRPGSLVLLGSRKRLWRTREERLARELTRQGHHVSLLHF